MKKHFTLSLIILLFLAVSLGLTACWNPIAGIIQKPTSEVTKVPAATDEAAPAATEEPAPVETETAPATEAPSPAETPEAAAPTEAPGSEPADFEPLPGSECDELSQEMSSVLGVEFSLTKEVSFQDFVTGTSGMGCAMSATGDGNDFENQGIVSQDVTLRLGSLGWSPDMQYAADGPTGTVVGFRKDNQLCLLDASWEASADAECDPDRPISECELTPEQQQFDIVLTCAQSTEEGTSSDAEATAAPSEAATSTPAPETLPEPTVQAPSAGVPPPEQARRIVFEPGATSATIDDSVAAGEVDLFVLQALAGQTMSVNLHSPKGSAVLAIWGADGTVLISDHAGARDWTGQLPSTQDYYISVSAVAGTATAYTLYVSVSALPNPTPGPQPIRIEFAPGTDTATVGGNVPPGGAAHYVLRALAGQTMSVNIVNASGSVWLAIWGADGTVLISDHAGATSWSGQLPLTQDYYIDVISQAGTTPGFTLQVIIPPQPGPGPEPPTKRITFAPGSVSAIEQGEVAPDSFMRYLVAAMAGQTMTVDVSSAQGDVVLVIWGADGTVLLSDHAGATSWSGVLPASQDYIIDVKPMGVAPTFFTLQVTIPPL